MATSRKSSSHSLIGWFFVAGGVVYLLGLFATHELTKVSGPWWNFFAFILLGIAFLLLFLWRVGTLLRLAFIVAAVGWVLLGIASVASKSLGTQVIDVAVWIALLGSLVAGVLVIVRHTFSRFADLAFLFAGIFAALFLADSKNGFDSGFLQKGTVETVVAILFAALYAVSGVLLQRKK